MKIFILSQRRILFLLVLGIFCLGGTFSFFVSCAAKKNQKITFVDVTAESRVISLYGADFYAWGDFNSDDYPDIIITRHRIAPLLYLNQKMGIFQDIFPHSGIIHDEKESPETSLYLDKHGCACGDFNNDGKLDLYISNGAKAGKGSEYNQLYKNEGNLLKDIAETAGVRDPLGRGRNAAWADFDSDGFMDLFIANYPRKGAPSLVFKNRGDGTFSKFFEFKDINPDENLYGAWSDFTGDGFMDLTIFSERNGGTVSLFENDSGSGFRLRHEFLATSFGWADFNNDGFLDLVLANVSEQGGEQRRSCPHQILINKGQGDFSFKKYINSNNTIAFGLALGDLENDGDLDIYIQNGDKNLFYLNKGGLEFQNMIGDSPEENSLSKAPGNRASFVDYDNDGDLDLFIVKAEDKGYSRDLPQEKPNSALRLFKNDSISKNWIKLKLVGTKSNREGIGAKIFIRAKGAVQYKEAGHGESGSAQDALPAHFGLGDAPQVEWIIINWPSGINQTLKNVSINQMIIIHEKGE
jgi:hypothetical protein